MNLFLMSPYAELEEDIVINEWLDQKVKELVMFTNLLTQSIPGIRNKRLVR